MLNNRCDLPMLYFKLGLLLSSTVFALHTTDLLLLVCMNAALVIVCLLFPDSFREILSVVKRIALGLPLLLLICIASELTKSRTLAAAIIPGSLVASLFILKVHYILWANLFLIRSTEPRHIVLALGKLRVPRELRLMIIIILRFFPIMFDEAKAVFQAQRARGFELRRAFNPANWLPLAVPLVVNVMKISTDLAVVIELKGLFDGD